MPRTINEGFTTFLRKLTPTSGETEAARRHRASIEACLKNNFDMYRFFRTGSFGNGTSISGYSDVDYFASLPSNKISSNSSSALSQVRKTLQNRFSSTTGIVVDCPAVKIPFGSDAKDDTEVAPALYEKDSSAGHKIYKIADCSGGWMLSSPDAHNSYVRRIDQKLNNKVKPLIRFIKAWKFYRSVPISSFYLELRVAKYANEESSIVYDIDILRIFRLLNSTDLASFQDPMGVSGYISACKTSSMKEEAQKALKLALHRAENAREADRKGNTKEAFEWWDKLYYYEFPSYNY